MIIIRKPVLNDAERIAKVHVCTWQSAYKDLVSSEYLNSLSVNKSKEKWEKNISENSSIIYVAESQSQQIVGFISGGKNRDLDDHSEYKAEIYAVYVLADWARMGIGTKLFKAIVADFIELNYNSMLLWMLKGNSTEQFYQKLSGVCLSEKPYKIGGSTKTLVAYGFDNLDNLFD